MSTDPPERPAGRRARLAGQATGGHDVATVSPVTTSGGRRDRDAVRRGLERWLAGHPLPFADGALASLVAPAAGWSNETLVAAFDSGDRAVVRLPPVVATFPDHDFLAQAHVMEVAAAAGIPVPAPVVACDDEAWLGSPFLVMPFVEGDIPGPASVFDPWLTDATAEEQRQAQGEMIRVLAEVHRVDWAASTELAGRLRGAAPHATLADEVAWRARSLEWASAGDPPPRIAAVLRWCAATCPTRVEHRSLLWGDPRLENIVFGPGRRAAAVLDWEMASIGPAELDLGWYLGLERVLRELTGGMVVAGFRTDDDVVATYERAVGRPVGDLDWHRVFAVARSLCVNVRQARISADAGVEYVLPGDDTNPLVAIAERWIEAM
jgi:aminoglycoside phosphotransferase (APT) family kinase protein